MRRFIVGSLVTSALVLGGALPSGASPTKGDTLVLTCGDASVTVETNAGTGISAWGTDGTLYLVTSIEVRVYRGDLATEPDLVPLREFSKSFGNRVGQGEGMACSFREYNPDHNATAFEYVTVTTPG